MTRPLESYRCVRRNSLDHEAKAKKMVFARLIKKWRGQWSCYPAIEMSRVSHVSHRPSKYMPHDGGKGYIKTQKRQNYSRFASFLKASFLMAFRGGQGLPGVNSFSKAKAKG